LTPGPAIDAIWGLGGGQEGVGWGERRRVEGFWKACFAAAWERGQARERKEREEREAWWRRIMRDRGEGEGEGVEEEE